MASVVDRRHVEGRLIESLRTVARRRAGAVTLLVYALLSVGFFGIRLIVSSGSSYVGVFDDSQIPIWSYAWWLHAVSHGENPFVTHMLWAPSGVNLVWANTTPALAVALLPVTGLFGAVAAYNVVAVLLPAISAWAGFLLCRHLTGRFWPSFVGGYLFGFSSYVLGHMVGQPQLTAVFAVPLVALVLIRYVEGDVGRRGLAVQLGLLLALELYLSLEVAFELTLMLVLALVVAYALVPAARRRLFPAALAPLAGAYALAILLGAPLVYYALTDLRVTGFQPPNIFVADALNVIVPTNLEASGAGWAHAVAKHFAGNYSEQGAFIGLPLIAIVLLYARRRWRTPEGRFLLAALLLATLASFGPELTVAGNSVLPLPTPLGHETLTLPGVGTKHVPLFNNALPVRLVLFASLASAVIVALWLASTRGLAPWLLAALGVALLVPNPAAGVWATRYSIPAFFTDARYRGCLAPNEIVLPQPIGSGGQAMLWQVRDSFRFRLAGGRVQTSPPSVFLHPPSRAQISVGYDPVANQVQLLRRYIADEHVTAAIVDKRQASTWAPALDRVARRRDLGGVLFYRVAGTDPGACPRS